MYTYIYIYYQFKKKKGDAPSRCFCPFSGVYIAAKTKTSAPEPRVVLSSTELLLYILGKQIGRFQKIKVVREEIEHLPQVERSQWWPSLKGCGINWAILCICIYIYTMCCFLSRGSESFIFDWFSLFFWMAFLDFKGVHHFFHCVHRFFHGFHRCSIVFMVFPWFSLICPLMSFVFSVFHGFHRFFHVFHQFLHDFYSLKIHENMIRKLS